MGSVDIAKNEVTSNLGPDHVIYTLMKEHDVILGFLDELEKINQNIQQMKGPENLKGESQQLNHVAHHLVEAELHYKREEEVLFPEIEKRGISGPPEVMRLEHKDLRKYKKELSNLVKNISEINFKKELNLIVEPLIKTLREHIFKENNILFPVALETIQEAEIWQKMKLECDKIGYCCFTPPPPPPT